MKLVSRITSLGIAAASLTAGLGLAIAESGSTAGRLGTKPTDTEIRVSVPSPTKKGSSVQERFLHDVNTDISIGGEKFRALVLERNWNVSVVWKQDPMEPKTTSKSAKPVVNRNPKYAERVEVTLTQKTVRFVAFEGDKVKLYYEDEIPASGKKAARKVKKNVTANLFPQAKFLMNGAEAKKSDFTENSEVQLDLIDDGSINPLIFRMSGNKAAM
jgi:hypothetical protein